MEWATNFISEIYTYLQHRDDTWIDRLNRLYTVALLSAFVTLITTQQYVVGGRIACWTPKEFTDAQHIYAQDVCWLGQTNYYVSQDLTKLDSPSSPRSYPFSTYPWLPVVLIGMSVSFAAPYLLIWHGLSTRSGIDINRLMKIDNQQQLTQTTLRIFLKKYSMRTSGRFYVISIYLFMKILYLINSIGHLLLINKLLSGKYFHIDIGQLLDILSVRHNMWSSAHFPIETMCDFMIRMLGHKNNWYTMQCILPFNLFTKRIFALLTIWFSILIVLNAIDLIIIWLWQRIFVRVHRYEYIFRFFRLYELYLHKKDDNQVIMSKTRKKNLREEFVYNHLGIDGYLLLKFLHANTTDLNMSYLVGNLFEQFLQMKSRQSRKFTSTMI